MTVTRALLLFAALGVTACDDSPLSPSDIVGGTWRLISLQEAGADPILVEDPSRYTLELEADGQADIMSDCNSCGGSYVLSGSSLTIGPVVCTRVFCGDDSLDPDYPLALDRAQSVSIDDGEMTIDGDGVTLRFQR